MAHRLAARAPGHAGAAARAAAQPALYLPYISPYISPISPLQALLLVQLLTLPGGDGQGDGQQPKAKAA